MMKGSKICGISDPKTLDFIVNHPYPPSLVSLSAILESLRYVKITKLKELLKIKKKQCKYVAVIVKNDEATLERIKNLPFDYYQIYDYSPDDAKKIKEKYKKIIIALTIENKEMLKNIRIMKTFLI